MKIILMVLIGVGIMYLATLKAQDKSISGGAYPTVSPKTEPIVVKGSGGSNPDPLWTKEDYEAKAKDNNREVMSAVISSGGTGWADGGIRYMWGGGGSGHTNAPLTGITTKP